MKIADVLELGKGLEVGPGQRHRIFHQAFMMTNGPPVNSTLFFAYHLFNNAFRYLDMGYAAAMAWFLFVIVLALTGLQMRGSKKWVHYEG